MNYTANLHLPIIPSSQYTTTLVVDMIAANQGEASTSAFMILDTVVAGKQNKITVNPPGQSATDTISTMEIDGTVYNVTSQITIDTAMSATSTNPVENRVITAALGGKQDTLGVNPSGTATDELTKLTINGTIYNVRGTAIVIDDDLSTTSTNPVQNKVITTALNNKVDSSALNAMSLKVSDQQSQDPSAELAQSFTITIGGTSTIYNLASQTIVDSALSPVSTNPVQNKVITEELNLKVSRSELNQAMDSFVFDTARAASGAQTLGSITVGTDVWNLPEAGITTVDDAISSTSENPVQNKAIKAALDLKLDAADADDISITLSENRSADPSALTLQCVIFNDTSGTTIYNMPDVEAIIDQETADFEFLNAESAAAGASDAYGIMINNEDIYNFRDGRIPGLFTVGYNYATPVASGDIIADAGLIAAYTAHMPITINGWLLSYQNVSGNDVRYLTATLSGTDVLSRIVVFNTSTNAVTFYETAGSGGSTVVVNPTLVGTETQVSGLEVDGTKYSVLTTQDVQSMINTAIGNALNALY